MREHLDAASASLAALTQMPLTEEERAQRLAIVPVVYPFVLNDSGEGVQAKRWGNAVIVRPPDPAHDQDRLLRQYGRYEQLMDQHCQLQTLDPSKLPRIQDRIWQLDACLEALRDTRRGGV